MHTRTIAHLERNDFITDVQNGFRKELSTTDTIFKYMYMYLCYQI